MPRAASQLTDKVIMEQFAPLVEQRKSWDEIYAHFKPLGATSQTSLQQRVSNLRTSFQAKAEAEEKRAVEEKDYTAKITVAQVEELLPKLKKRTVVENNVDNALEILRAIKEKQDSETPSPEE